MYIDKMSRLNPAQQFVVDAKMLETGFSCVLQFPTGAGKTWLARRAIRETLQRGMRAVYLTPLRALADELHPLWQSEFAPIEVGVFTGDYGRNGKQLPVPFANARVLIMTPERLDVCTRIWRSHWHWIPEVSLLIIDEVHILGDRGRGARLEGAISRFRRLNPFCRFLCLSATLGNREELADWLCGIEYASSWRPVPLTWRIARYRKADEKPHMLAKEIARTREAGGRSLAFVQSRRRCEMLCSFLRDQGIRADYHHAGLTHNMRRSIEKTFRSSEIDALVATGTLEMGLNMPVRQVLLYDTQFFDGLRFIPLPVNTLWQRAGRAGRPGLDTTGEAVLFAAAWDRSADRYPAGKFERIESALSHPASLAEQIIAEIGSGLCRSELQLKHTLDRTLAAFQSKPLPIHKMVEEMISAGMIRTIKSEGEVDLGKRRFAVTSLGRIATRHLLQPQTVLMIRDLFQQLPNFTHFDALFSLGLTPDCEPIIPVDFEELPVLGMQLAEMPSFIAVRLQGFRRGFPDATGKRLLSALKTAAILLAWCKSGDDEITADEFGVYPFELVRLQASFDRLLMAATAISKHVFADPTTESGDCTEEKTEEMQRIELLHHMVKCTLPAETATLTLAKGIGGKWARKLRDLGFRDIHLLGSATLEALTNIPGLSCKRAKEWQNNARLLSSVPIPSTESSAPFIDCALPNIKREDYDPYRLRRARDLTVSLVSTGEYTVSGGGGASQGAPKWRRMVL